MFDKKLSCLFENLVILLYVYLKKKSKSFLTGESAHSGPWGSGGHIGADHVCTLLIYPGPNLTLIPNPNHKPKSNPFTLTFLQPFILMHHLPYVKTVIL